ncbi:MAG: endopeptidase La [Thermodesulfobacteriales bacterium]|nr:MAG: endopeptidase La [Thermodesulfobacteriales bacterium]
MPMFFNNEEGSGQVETLPLLPLRDVVIFPYMVAPLFVGREKSIRALEEAMKKNKEIFLVAQKDAKTNDPTEKDIYDIGTIGTIVQMLRLPDGTVKVLVEGKGRACVKNYLPNKSYFMVEVETVPEANKVGVETEALIRTLVTAFENYVNLNKKIPSEVLVTVSSIEEPGRLSDTISSHLSFKLEDKQEILETLNPAERLEKIYEKIQSEVEIMQIEKKIRGRVKKQMEKAQKEYYLTEQMRAIQKELGEKDDLKSEIQEFEDKVKKKKMPEEAEQKVKKEIKKLKQMSPMSAEATVVRNYVDWLLSLPWKGEATDDRIDIDEAQQILDDDHFGLEKPKERILEYLAVQALTKKIKGPILCFVGPPGVGKTSLAKSIAQAMGRKFIRVSLGGVRDEAEIRGHRRTYIGALPGKIVQGVRKAGTNNPVFLLDEIDKLGMDFRGDPASALLEALDPEQNIAFNDHYLEVDYDLSNVMFITTANVLHTIPWALQDRMEIIRISGYTEDEKLEIAKKFLVPKQREAHGLKNKNLKISDNTILDVIRYYTREAGVRTLEREIATLCRKAARDVVKKGPDHEVKLTPAVIKKENYLGIPKFKHGEIEEKDHIGMSTGLAWTEVGGELLTIEVSIVPGKGTFTVTGKLGEVMQESTQAAMSYVRSRAERLGLERGFHQKVDIHIHVPEGATPKDGPSAGIAIATAIVSALIRKPVKHDLAMTGEITLRGRVLPIGGLKEKILAAHRGKVKTIVIPQENEKDLKEIRESILKDIKIVIVEHMDDVLDVAIVSDVPILQDIVIPPPTMTIGDEVGANVN